MPIIPTPTFPEDGSDADVGDYNPILIAILAVLNGQIDGDNIAPGSLPWSVMDGFSDSIPSSAMQDEGSLVKYRDEADISFVASGIVWSVTTGLGASMTAGVVYTTAGTRVVIDAVSNRQFTASKDTYIDIAPNGSVSYAEVSNNAAAPAITSGYIRIALVISGASTISAIHSLARRSPGNEIGRFVAGADTTTLSVQNLPYKKHLTVRVLMLTNTSDINGAATFNNDTGANYRVSEVGNNSGYSASGNTAAISMDPGTSNMDSFVEFRLSNIPSRYKIGIMESVIRKAAGTGPDQRSNYFQWQNTSDAINRIDISNQGAVLVAGSELIVFGDD